MIKKFILSILLIIAAILFVPCGLFLLLVYAISMGDIIVEINKYKDELNKCNSEKGTETVQ